MWREALVLGHRVVVRPSQRDPLTPFRLVTALRRADLPDDRLVFAPCDHTTAGLIVSEAIRNPLCPVGPATVPSCTWRRGVFLAYAGEEAFQRRKRPCAQL